MARGIIIPADTALPIEDREFDTLEQYQNAVGGYIEPIAIDSLLMTLYVNEDGKSQRLIFNQRATVLWWLLSSAARNEDLIVGNAVLVVDDPEQDAAVRASLIRNSKCRVEVQLPEAHGEWLAGSCRFSSWFEAARFALALDARFEFIDAVRVTNG